MRAISIYDTTLRDGCQGEDVVFSVEDKLRIARKLDELGVHYLEGGWPGSNPRDIRFFQEMKRVKLRRATLVAFGSTRKKGVPCRQDEQLRALLAAQTEVVAIVGKTWDLHVRDVLRVSLEENLDLIRETVEHLRRRRRRVFFDAEHFFDGYRANRDYALAAVQAAAEAGAELVCLCDTNGGSLPAEVSAAVAAVAARVEVPLGIHTHNDGEMAVANSLVAVEAGASQVQGTINGFGERCGNANLCSIIPALMLKLKRPCLKPGKLKQLRELSHFVYELANQIPPVHQPYVGDAAFAHKGGQHGDAVQKNPATYEHVLPEAVGNRRRILISDQAGKSSLAAKAEEFGLRLDRAGPEARRILEELKALEAQGYQFEGAEASFELLMQKALRGRKQFFRFKGFRVIDEKRPEDKLPRAEATIMVEVDGQEEHTAAQGVGPVNALDHALRKALLRFYPALGAVRLIDFKVRVLPAGLGTASQVRVLIESTDGQDQWATVGVSDNIIEASWQALIDAVDYKLYKDRKSRKAGARHALPLPKRKGRRK